MPFWRMQARSFVIVMHYSCAGWSASFAGHILINLKTKPPILGNINTEFLEQRWKWRESVCLVLSWGDVRFPQGYIMNKINAIENG